MNDSWFAEHVFEIAVRRDALAAELQAALSPVGFVELALVERIAIALWRQRRLVTAETASIYLARVPRRVR